MNKYITHLKLLCLSLFLLLSISPMSASSHSKDGKLDIQEILFGHINDSYEWHITDIGGHPVVLPLPIIVKSSTGFHVFLSNQFSEEHDSKGNRQRSTSARYLTYKECCCAFHKCHSNVIMHFNSSTMVQETQTIRPCSKRICGFDAHVYYVGI